MTSTSPSHGASSPVRVAAVAMVLVAALQLPAGSPGISVRPIVREGQLVVSFRMNDDLAGEVRDAIQSGLATTFSYDVELRRTGWFDRLLASTAVAASVRFDNLTRRYQMTRSVDGRIEEARPSERFDDVRVWMTEFEHVVLSAAAVLEVNGEYAIRVRAHTRPRNASFLWPWGGALLGNAKFTFIP